jgi:hypothetical protein
MRIVFLLMFALTGCASLQNAGVSEYNVRPFITASGPVCCEVVIKNGKELESLKARIVKQGDDFILDISIQGVTAFRGQEIAKEAIPPIYPL